MALALFLSIPFTGELILGLLGIHVLPISTEAHSLYLIREFRMAKELMDKNSYKFRRSHYLGFQLYP
jgi:hypothetical protein